MYLSPEFALSFLVFLLLYWLPGRGAATRLWQNGLLCGFSFLFYGFLDPRLTLYLLAFAVTVYCFGLLIRNSDGGEKRVWFSLGILSLVLYLCTLKYYAPLRDSVAPLVSGLSGWPAQLLTLDILVPAGVSFYTFQAIALLTACYRNDPVTRSLGPLETTLYLAFFPTVLAGPICRPQHLLPRLRWQRRFLPMAPALGWICRGLFKKLVVAHWLATAWVDPMFAEPQAYNGLELMLGACAYSIQIYADFSGLTDLVRGIAWLLGFRLPENFNLPYWAGSPRDFWRRWHISLSTWIRDFVYIPLGGSRGSLLRTQVNLLLAMVISGLWHGAGLNFVVWGGLHGMACVAGNLWPRHWQLPGFLRVALTFAYVTVAWVFFRAADLSQALDFLGGFANLSTPFSVNVPLGLTLLVLFFAFQAFWVRSLSPLLARARANASPLNLAWQGAAATLIAYLCIELGPSGVPNFIYFKF